MKRNKELYDKAVGENAHAEASGIILGEGILPSLLSKFKDVESLCKAYNSLESEFTKRCQTIARLEGEIEKLKSISENGNSSEVENQSLDGVNATCNEAVTQTENVDNGHIGGLFEKNKLQSQIVTGKTYSIEKEEDAAKCEDKTSLDSEESIKFDKVTDKQEVEKDVPPEGFRNSVSEGETINAILKFFGEYPKASEHCKEFATKLAKEAVTEDILKSCYIGILERDNESRKTYSDLGIEDIPEVVKEKVVKDYLAKVKAQTFNPILMREKGLVATLAPLKPKNLAEAGALAEKIIKFK